MSYANLDGVPSQTAGVSSLLASDWNTYVRDNFDSIKFGHVVVADNTAKSAISAVEGIMVYQSDVDTLFLYTGSAWVPAVDTVSLVDSAVETAKINDLAVTTAKINDLSVTTGKIDAGAVTSAKIADDTIVNADVNSAAAIAYSKLNLATSIVNADVSATAAIAYSKLNLAASVTSADIVSVKQSQISDFVFTTEAARDAAITSPTEGMRAYLTAPTIPAATGDTYAGVPTGIQTIYNGSVWVCVTEIGATTNTTGTTGSTSYTPTLTGGGTNPSVTLVTGTQALVSLSVSLNNDATLSIPAMSFAVSGATTLAAADAQGFGINISGSGREAHASRTLVITGLTAGTNTFTLNYKTTIGNTSNRYRSIVVKGIA